MRYFDAELAVERLEAQAAATCREHVLDCWRAHRAGRIRGGGAPEPLADPATRRRLEELRRIDNNCPALLLRRIELLWRACVHAALSSDAAVVAAGSRLDDAAETDEAQRAVVLRELFAARNLAARRMGWPGFYQLSLALGELAGVDHAAVLRGSDLATREAWQRSSGKPPTRAGYLAGELRSGAARDLLAGMGLDLGRVRVDLVEAPGLASRTYPVEPPGDVRIVAAPLLGMAARRGFWHELGHAAYAAHLDAGLPWSLATAPARCVDEGVAELFADLGEGQSELVADLGLDADAARELAANRRAARLAWQRWQLARAAFEREAYADPGADLDRCWEALVREYVGQASHTAWAMLGHLRTDPGSQIEYLIADQIRQKLRARVFGGHPSGMSCEAGALLRDGLFRHGAARPWRVLLAGLGCDHAV